MSTYELDGVDRGILHALQENARDVTIETMGERVGVSASTVRNRITDKQLRPDSGETHRHVGVVEENIP